MNLKASYMQDSLIQAPGLIWRVLLLMCSLATTGTGRLLPLTTHGTARGSLICGLVSCGVAISPTSTTYGRYVPDSLIYLRIRSSLYLRQGRPPVMTI